MSRAIYAAYDDEGVYVYQAFSPDIVAAALANGTFAKGFNLERMTWIKPSFGWMLYRSGYATKHRQEAILKIKLTHAGFLTILQAGVETSHDSQLFATREDWKRALDASEVRFQWDPDRQLNGGKMERRAIQLGIRGTMVRRYVQEWIIGLEEVTSLAQMIHQLVKNRRPLGVTVPDEQIYTIPQELQQKLGIYSEKP